MNYELLEFFSGRLLELSKTELLGRCEVVKHRFGHIFVRISRFEMISGLANTCPHRIPQHHVAIDFCAIVQVVCTLVARQLGSIQGAVTFVEKGAPSGSRKWSFRFYRGRALYRRIDIKRWMAHKSIHEQNMWAKNCLRASFIDSFDVFSSFF